MLIKIEPSKLCGRAIFPPSKSDSHRLLIAAALADGKSKIRGISKCDDVLATIDSLNRLGADIYVDGDATEVIGADIRNANTEKDLFVNESGSTLRFLIPLVLLTEKEIRFECRGRLAERPMGIYENIILGQGGRFAKEKSAITIEGSLHSGEYRIPGNVSSQFITGLLFALPLLDGDSKIIIEPPFESKPYVDMTVHTLDKFGVNIITQNENTMIIPGGQKYTPSNETVEGDWSGGAFLLALRLLHPDIVIEGYDGNSLQGDRACIELFDRIKEGSGSIDISDCPDLGPILFAMAVYFGEAEFIGTKRLRIKESDRCQAMKEELEKFGAMVEVYDNSVTLKGGNLHAPTECLSGHGDHRIVMSLAVLCSTLGGEIDGAEAVNKSYPEFFEAAEKLGLRANILEQK